MECATGSEEEEQKAEPCSEDSTQVCQKGKDPCRASFGSSAFGVAAGMSRI